MMKKLVIYLNDVSYFILNNIKNTTHLEYFKKSHYSGIYAILILIFRLIVNY